MKLFSLTKYFSIALILLFVAPGYAQVADGSATSDANYTKTITARADKIVAVLGITDSVKYKRVQNVIIDQYRNLSQIHDTRNAQVKEIKQQAGDDKAGATAKTKAVDDDVDAKLSKLHAEYLAKLGADLNAGQIDKVKDAMTYNILGVTYKAYIDEVVTLTDVQKAQIKAWLIEAREIAIDAESSEKKHAVFTKYKGRINNYLSAQGYDMKKEAAGWEARRNAAVAEPKQQN